MGPYDLVAADGVTIEVKSSAYLQSWPQRRLWTSSFGIWKTTTWEARTGKADHIAKRQAEVYIFCLLAHKDKTTVESMDLSQWRFYVVPTSVLDSVSPEAKTISLAGLESLAKEVLFADVSRDVNAKLELLK